MQFYYVDDGIAGESARAVTGFLYGRVETERRAGTSAAVTALADHLDGPRALVLCYHSTRPSTA